MHGAGEVEFRNLAPTELAVCTEAARPGGVRLRDTDAALVESLHKRGLIYLEVPIRPDDHVSIPPLEVRIGASGWCFALLGCWILKLDLPAV